MSVFDVAFIGTSLTANFGTFMITDNGYWQPSLKARLRATKKQRIRFYDFGISGAQAAALLPYAATASSMHPRVAIIECGMNDAYVGNALATFKSNVVIMVNSFKSNSPDTRVFLMTMNPAIAPALAWKDTLPAYYQALRDLSASEGVGLIDNAPLWGAPTSAQMWADGVHPTAYAMAATMVPNILATLDPLVS